MDSIRAFFKGRTQDFAPRNLEHSIVRPIYSSLGNYYLHENAIEQIVAFIAEQRKGIARARSIKLHSTGNGMIIQLQVDIHYGAGFFPGILKEVQQEIKAGLELLTGLQITQVNITARRLVVPEKKKQKI